MSTILVDKPILLSHEIGFTLVELLLSLTVIAIVLSLTAPSLKEIIMNNRISAQTDALSGALSYARNTAISQNIDVLVCPSSTSGSTNCGATWQNGWIIVGQTSTGGNRLLQSFFTGPNDPILSGVAIAGVTANSVTFDSRGIATTHAHFKICDSRGAAFARSVEVLPTGFIQTSATTGVAVWDDSVLTCP